MSFVDKPSGRYFPALAATAAFHALLLLAIAASFEVSQIPQGEGDAPSLAVFDVEPAKPAVAEETKAVNRAQKAPNRAETARSAAPQTTPSPTVDAAQAVSVPVMPARPSLPIPSVAEPVIAPAPPPKSESARPDALTAYTRQLRQRILANLPRGLRKEGEATISFTLFSTGELAESRIARSSGDPQLDRLALRTLRQSAPFSPPPPDVPESELSFTIAVRFH